MWEDDDDDEPDFDPEEERRKLESKPIFQKAEEIRELAQRIVETMDKNDPESEIQSSLMLEDSMIIPAKIAGAEAMDDFILKMENAVIIKIHARSLLTRTSSLKYLELVDPEYLQLLRDEIEAFRLLFKDWVTTFHIDTTKEADGWGLFVPDN
ncbi:MAG TPA: hypothetical protein VFW11_05375 [Cyclobacteriaceae bacterium]|nr:hypothetical protein [Cyclobacteriaceae bacterium]